MMMHPDHMMAIARQRQEELVADSRPFVVFTEIANAAGIIRRQTGLGLIRLGTWLGGYAPELTPPARLSTPQA